MAKLFVDHASNNLLTVARDLAEGGVREPYRTIEAQAAALDQFAIHSSLND